MTTDSSRRRPALQAILFDLDDTLLDTYGTASAALASTCTLAAARYPGAAEPRIRAVYREVIHEVDRRMAAQEIYFTTAREFYRHRWREILSRCEMEPTHAVELADHYAASRRENYCFYPEALELLSALRHQYRMALVTNGPSHLQREKMAAIAVERWIPEVYVSGELGFWKPQAAIFHHVLAHIGCSPGEAVMVGDSLTNDIAGAAAAGMRTVWVNRRGFPLAGEVRPDSVVRDLRPLPEILAAW